MPAPATTVNSILVLGLGNEILTDDGIGPRIVHGIDKSSYSGNVVFESVSLGGLELLEIIRDYQLVIIVDAMKTGTIPIGEVACYKPQDFNNTLHLSNLHDIDFLTALELGRRTGMKIPCAIHIVAIEIAEDRVFSNDFSPEISAKYEDIRSKVEHIISDLIFRKSLAGID